MANLSPYLGAAPRSTFCVDVKVLPHPRSRLCLFTRRLSRRLHFTSPHTTSYKPIVVHIAATSMADKENVAPVTSSDPLQRLSALSPSLKKATRKGRSKSIGPGALDEPEAPKLSARDRRKSAFVPAAKSILSKDEESARAARRKSMANRRVSFAPEATLHTWDIVMDQHEHTTSTDSDSTTRRASHFSSASDSDAATYAQEEEDRELLESEDDMNSKRSRRSSGIPPMNFNNPEDTYSSGTSGSEDGSGSDNGEDDASDDEGTAMSLSVDDPTLESHADSEGSTGSSERLEASLKAAARLAGTRGIEYDEFGDMSMEVADEEVTNAMQPWALCNGLEKIGSASLDQENVNPFSPAFSEVVTAQQGTVTGEETQDMSMDVTRAVGGIMNASRFAGPQSSPRSEGDETMDLTQAVGRIAGQKRRRSTTEHGSPGVVVAPVLSKRKRPSANRTSMGDDTMDLTMAVGGIQSTAIPDRRRSLRGRRSSGMGSDTSDATMDITHAVGTIVPVLTDITENSFAGDEELSMELTTVIGGIRELSRPISKDGSRLGTPQSAQSSQPLGTVNTTLNGQEPFMNTPDLVAKQPLEPMMESAKQASPPAPVREAMSPMRLSRSPRQFGSPAPPRQHLGSSTQSKSRSPGRDEVTYPELPPLTQNSSPVRTPSSTPQQRQGRNNIVSEERQSNIHVEAPNQSPTKPKQRGPSSKESISTPEKLNESQDDTRTLHDSLKLMTTPRKETLKHATPKKTPARPLSPAKPNTPRGRPTPRGSVTILPSPVRHLREDLERIRVAGGPQQKIGLQEFLAKAGIRFMDLTTTKRRLTVAPPSKTKGHTQSETEVVSLEDGVVAAACTVPELELYQHACLELKRFTKEGKQVITELEEQTLRAQPPLVQSYAHAPPDRKLTLDAQMRDMKTNARLRSKEMWYAWRSQLLEELMGGLSKIGEGLIRDDETLAHAEEVLDQALPPLLTQHASLRQDAAQLERTANAVPEGEKEQLSNTRESLTIVNAELAEKRVLLERLRKEVEEQESTIEHLQESKVEFAAAIEEANRVRETCRGISIDEITALQGKFVLQDGWQCLLTNNDHNRVRSQAREKVFVVHLVGVCGTRSLDHDL